jgi:type IV secretory pathway VirJ component
MSWWLRMLLFFYIGCASMHAGALDPRENPVGPLHVVQPSGSMRGFVVLYSGAQGWDERAQHAAADLARAGALVAGIDLREYRRYIRERSRKCFYLVGDAEAIGRELQRARNEPDYHAPILAGIGAGGALAEIVLRHAPPHALAGAVSVDPVRPKQAPCVSEPTAAASGSPLPGFWTVGLTSSNNALVKSVAASGTAIDVRQLPPNAEPYAAIVALVAGHLDPLTPVTGVAKLPLIELPAAEPTPLLAIILSGDGGWRDLDKVIAEELSRNGVAVVGWDCLRYFWSRKSPAEAGQDLAAVIDAYSAKWNAPQVALIGYSFGADVLPFLYQQLSDREKARVVQLSFLGLTAEAEFEIKVAGWISSSHSESAQPTQPALAAIKPALIQCFYGEQEEDSVCPALAARGVETVRTSGGHHFDGDYAALARRILAGFKTRSREALR